VYTSYDIKGNLPSNTSLSVHLKSMHERITESIRNDFDENKCFFEGACGLSADLKCGNIIQVFL